jgi:hypothetical protein
MIMARVDSVKAQKILMYLWAQGFKYKEMATEAGLGLGWDIINYLKSSGHTLDPDAEKRLACDGDKKSFSPIGIGIAGNTYSEIVGGPWSANDPVVAETFGIQGYSRCDWRRYELRRSECKAQQGFQPNWLGFNQHLPNC